MVQESMQTLSVYLSQETSVTRYYLCQKDLIHCNDLSSSPVSSPSADQRTKSVDLKLISWNLNSFLFVLLLLLGKHQFRRKYVVESMVCIFNFFVVPSSFLSSPTCLFPLCHHFRGLSPHPSREPATAGCLQGREGSFPSTEKELCALGNEGPALKCAVTCESPLKSVSGTLQGGYWVFNISSAASKNW